MRTIPIVLFFLAVFVGFMRVCDAAGTQAIRSQGLSWDAPLMLTDAPGTDGIQLVGSGARADIYVDRGDATVVQIAARILSEDIERVSGQKPTVSTEAAALGKTAVIIGTIGKSAPIDALIESGKLDVSRVKGHWESCVLATVSQPLSNVEHALVIAGSDRRGTAYGVMELSEQIGVSPWYWWADVTPAHRESIAIKAGTYIIGEPAVKYRGIFINDEDFGIRPWASKTFDPKFGNIGPKTYEKVFELLLRLKANYLWPAMHPGSMEFGKVDDNIKLADDWAIVMGASHAEPMNRNNVDWDKATKGEWRYDTNHDAIHQFWEEWAKKRGPYEAVWTLGLRGIHDSPMNGPKDTKARVQILQNAIADERSLLAKYVNPKVEQIAQMFCPYKEVLLLYQNGLKVPEDVTLMWPDDNFGYVRELCTPEEQKRSGGSGVYYHISYWGQPESYLWLCTTPPSLIWEEMTKAYDNGAKNIWIVNVGDIKPGEIGMEFFLRLARNVKGWDESSQIKFLTEWATQNFGAAQASDTAGALEEYYRLNCAAKPEHLLHVRFSDNQIKERLEQFSRLVQRADGIYSQLPLESKDAFYETVLYPVRCSALLNRKILSENTDDEIHAYEQIQAETKHFNMEIAGGKWMYMMSDNPQKLRVFQKPGNSPTTQITTAPAQDYSGDDSISLDAGRPACQSAESGESWRVIEGLGNFGNSIALLPAVQIPDGKDALEYDFEVPRDAAAKVMVYCLPTHAIHPGLKARYSVGVDGEAPSAVDIDAVEFSKQWSQNVLHNDAIGMSESKLAPGRHTLTIRPLDPGLVFEKIVIDFGSAKPSNFNGPAGAQ